MRGHVLAVVGGQYGSEGKGAVVHAIANQYQVHVRVGGPNAGHTFYHKGRRWVQQVVPCGWTNPEAVLMLGRGMLVDLDLLVKEITAIAEVDPSIWDRVILDEDAGVLSRDHHIAEGGVEGGLHKRIGSTGEGVGAARIARIQRDSTRFQTVGTYGSTFGSVPGNRDYDWRRLIRRDTPGIINWAINTGKNVLLEGTQGSGLSLIHGPWPYVTSADTNAGQLCADVGVAPTLLDQTMLVFRTFPIRVAGNSGPLYREMTWDQLSARVGRPIEEKTTVTKKVRRVGEFDYELLRNSRILNNPTSLALTFLDYLFPEDAGKTWWDDLSGPARDWIKRFEEKANTIVAIIQTGPETSILTGNTY